MSGPWGDSAGTNARTVVGLGGWSGSMWFYVLLIGFVVLFVWWLTRTNLYRHRSRHDPGLGGGRVDPRDAKALDNAARFRRDGLPLGPSNKHRR